jgi:hypothetical protein
MDTYIRVLLRLLLLVAIFFLLGLLVFLFRCGCWGRPIPPGADPGRGEHSLSHASVDPARTSGRQYPAFQPPINEFNEDRAHTVPTGPLRGTLTPTRQGSKLQPMPAPGSGGGAAVQFTGFNSLGTTAGSVGTPPDMNAARSGQVAMLSYNTNVLLSTDGASTWTLLNPTTIFPSAASKDAAGNLLDNGLCCDQVVQYVPQIDRFIWLMQFCGSGTTGCLSGINRVRIASASPQQIINSGGTSWTYWDVLSGTFNLGTTTMDYPDLAVGDNFLYFSADAVGNGLLVTRMPLNQIQNSQSLSIDYTTPSDSSVAYGGHLSQNTGDAVFWAGHNKNNQMRIFTMKEGSGQYSWRDVDIDSWPNGTISSIAKDGTTDWLQFLGTSFPGNAILGLTRRTPTEVWFAWTAAAGSGFKQAQVQIVELDISNYNVISQWQIWNDNYAFAFPSLATNGQGEVGISLAWGGNNDWGNHAVGFLGDFVVWFPEASDTAITRWGDYVSVRRNVPDSSLFDASGYAVLKQTPPATGIRFDPYYIQFGRPAAGGSPIH